MKKILLIAAITMMATTTAQADWWKSIPFISPAPDTIERPDHCGNSSACGIIDGKCVDARCKDKDGNPIPDCNKTMEMVMCNIPDTSNTVDKQ